jgi:RNA recognition motif-containing protein
MGKRLYVGNLPYDADENSLREVFAQDGRIVERVHIVLDRETQRPRGFAFVEMATDDAAKAAMAALDGQLFGTRQLRVTEAEERRPGPGGPGGPRGPGGPPRGPGGGGPPRSAAPAGGGSGGGGGGSGRPDDNRNRFGPDARPKHERERDQRRAAPPPKRREDTGGDAAGGRRGSQRFDDDDDE